ncbi:hypothetical protein ARMSODRAFT_153516 [Armillaria solidipes]|uniref:Uncharacterized protein n=1 Tax=Armillaria solidipes TaxID=1076256 RepID=A0A2H3BGG2_9AGAR|nr:hypothetical protein ARMSODRAFT_153516 [Armillaria solidipes]
MFVMKNGNALFVTLMAVRVYHSSSSGVSAVGPQGPHGVGLRHSQEHEADIHGSADPPIYRPNGPTSYRHRETWEKVCKLGWSMGL